MKKYLFLETVYYEDSTTPIGFEYIETDEYATKLSSGNISMRPTIDFEANRVIELYDEEGNLIDTLSLSEEDLEREKKEYQEMPEWECPTFAECYDELRTILEKDELIVVGRNAGIDALLLRNACLQEGLRQFSFITKSFNKAVCQLIDAANIINRNDISEKMLITVDVISQLCAENVCPIDQLLAFDI